MGDGTTYFGATRDCRTCGDAARAGQRYCTRCGAGGAPVSGDVIAMLSTISQAGAPLPARRVEEEPMIGQLIERGGDTHGQMYALAAAVTSIGRSACNDIIVAGAYVSARHALVRREGMGYVLEDCGSTNGTRVNGERLSEARDLRSGDRITLPGEPGVTLVFDDGARTAEMPVARRAAGAYVIDLASAELRVHGTLVPLAAKEFRALALLHEREGALVSKEELAARVWPELDGQVADCNIEQLIARLRRKLAGEGELPSPLVTVRGLGYRLVLP